MTLRFIYNEPAAVLGDALVLADLHLGIEFELQQKGYQVSLQYPKEAERINRLILQTKARRVIFLGDVKHNVYGMEDKEERVLNAFFRKLKTKKITVCKGNHDSFIENCTGIEVEPAEGFVLDDHLLLHGHALPKIGKYRRKLLGHEHPLVRIQEGPHQWTDKAWIVSSSFVVFPHFGHLVGGRPFSAESHLSPALSDKECHQADLHLLSGTKIGKVSEL